MRAPVLATLLCLLPLGCGSGAAPSPRTPPTAPVSPPRFAVVVGSRPAGGSETTLAPDGTRVTHFEYLDNGRGPKVDLRLRFDADGTLRGYDAKGTDTFGTTIDEHFSRDGAHAVWSTTMDKGARDLTRPAYYLPIAPSADDVGLLAAAALRAGGQIDLLPDGRASVERMGEAAVDFGGQRLHLTAYAVLGLDLVPTPIWLDDDHVLFAQVEGDSGVVRAGAERLIPTLAKAQLPFERERAEANARRLAHRPPAAGLLITHARLFDAEARRFVADQAVLVSGERIAAVGPTATVTVPPGAEVVDAAGKALLPGLWDMHAHFSRGHGELDLGAGVTTIRDVGNDPDWLDAQKAAIDQGAILGPRILRGGFIEGRGKTASGSVVTAVTPDEAHAAVAFFAARHYEEIKIYNSIPPAIVPVLAADAHARGMRVSGHIPVGMLAAEAVRAGYDEIQHINQLELNFLADHTTDTSTLLRFTLIGEKASALDLSSQPVRDFVSLLLEHKTVLCPTLIAFEGLYLERPGDLWRPFVPFAERLPPVLLRGSRSGGLLVPAGQQKAYADAFPALERMTKLLYDAGVPIDIGTDGPSGLALPYEMELLVQTGLAPLDVLALATLGGARIEHVDGRSGSIAVGKDADLILIDGDPAARIGDVRRVVTVVKAGVVYDSRAVLAAVSVRPWK